MTQEEKAKAYDDLLVRLQKAKVDNNVCDERYCCVIDDIVPELIESEDERIRKALIEFVQGMYMGCCTEEAGKERDMFLTWLEKQGEQKSYNKFEPKFKVGDKIRIKTPSLYDKDMQVARIESYYYVCNHIGKFSSEVVPFSKESSYELFEQNPAWSEEDKAVLDALIRRLEGEDIYVSPHLAIECLKSIKDRVQPQNGIVTDEELIQAKKEAYNEALDKIEYHSGEPTFDDGWSAAIWYLKKRNMQPLPKQEWSEDDERIMIETIELLETANHPNKMHSNGKPLDFTENINWLKSLKQRMKGEEV